MVKMKRLSNKHLGLLLTSAVLIGACNPLNKMAKNASAVSYSVTPNPLEMHADSVKLEIAGNYPPKYFNKKAVVTVTPVLKDATSGDVVKEFKSVTLIGEAAAGEGQKINYVSGGSFKYNDKVPYNSKMENVSLELTANASYKTKSKQLGDSYKIGDGTIITPLLVQGDEKTILAKDKFTKTVPLTSTAEVNYLVNSSAVRPNELKDADVTAMVNFIKEGVANGYAFKNITTQAYASPEGEISLNENLANERAESASAIIAKELKKAKVEAAKDAAFFVNVGKGEDWLGFKDLMMKSSIKDKELILRILEMYPDVNKRELEIKNLAATYVEVADQILPKLRRSSMVLNVEIQSKTDEQLKTIGKSTPDSLNIEELLYAASLFDANDLSTKEALYAAATRVAASDWRGWNNLGYVKMIQNNLADAKTNFEKAGSLNASSPIVNNNLGAVARLNGDKEKAKEYYEKASGAGSEVNYNKGIIDIMEGNYASAASNMSGSKTFNEALAQLLNGSNSSALSTVDASNDKNTASGYYLKAIIGARNNNKDMVLNNLATAFKKDASLKDKAKKDAEFIKFREAAEFSKLFE